METYQPYQGVKVGKARYWDYSVRIKGVIYEISVNIKTGEMWVNKASKE